MKETIEIGKTGQIVTGTTPKTKNKKNYESNDICFFKPGDFKINEINNLSDSENYISNYAKHEARILPKDSLLITCIGIIGKIGILTKDAAFNQQINAIIPNKNFSSRFLAYSLLSIKDVLMKKANSPIVPLINKNDFSKFKIPIYDLNTQNEIVRTLDKINEAIINRKSMINDLNNLTESKYFEAIKNNDCKLKKLNELGESIIGLTYSPKDISKTGMIVLRSGNIQNGILDFSDIVKVDKNIKEKLLVQPGDILICSRNGSKKLVGKSAIINILNEKMTFGAFMTVYRSSLNKFLISFFHSDDFRNQLGASSTATINQITSSMLNNIEVKLPPTGVVNDFILLKEKIDKQKELIQQDIKDLESLLETKMHEYFD